MNRISHRLARVLLLALASSSLWIAVGANRANAEDGLLGIRTGKHGDSLRVVLDLTGTIPCSLEPVADSHDWVVVARGLCSAAPPGRIELDHPLIRAIEPGCVGTDLFIHLLSKRPFVAKGFDLTAQGDRPRRYVIDLYPDVDATSSAATASAEEAPVAAQEEPEPELVVTPEPLPRRSGNWRVLIDPGHGGKDPGAKAQGIREKDLVFDIGQRVVKTLNHTEGFEARLSRDRDEYLGLRQRRKIAEEFEADVFVSIHANSFRKSQAEGVEVYFLSMRGASDEASRELARLENEVDPDYDASQDNLPEGIPFSFDLRQSDTLRRSSALAESTLAVFERTDLAASRGVKQAGFMVLKSFHIPSILVEVGFLSNPDEAKRLKSTRYRARLAESIARGTVGYLRDATRTRAQLESASP